MGYLYLMPLISGAAVFLFSTAGFFLNTGKKEMIYGACSILSAACVVVQVGILL